GFESPHPADGKFHSVSVRTRRANVKISARTGYWSLTEAEVATSRVVPVVVPAEVTEALNRLADALPAAAHGLPASRHVMIRPATFPVLAAPTFEVVRGPQELEPAPRPEFARSQRVVVRAALVGGQPVDVAVQLLDRLGRPLTRLPVTTFAGSCDIP